MRKYSVAIALLGVASARCPDIGPDAFADILHNHAEITVFGGTDYHIENRKIPDFAVESTKKPRISVRKNGSECHYTRKIGKIVFGSFTLVKKQRNKMVIVERYRPDVVIIEEGHRHHHRHYRHR
jgi:hypothetical protein